MDNLTDLIKKEIKRQYGGVKAFAAQTGIPYGTINTSLYKGVGGSSFDFVMKICRLLGIRQVFNDEISQINGEYYSLVSKMEKLDARGIATVKAIIGVELDRCLGNRENEVVKSYNGIGHVESSDDHLKALIREVLEEQRKKSHEQSQ